MKSNNKNGIDMQIKDKKTKKEKSKIERYGVWYKLKTSQAFRKTATVIGLESERSTISIEGMIPTEAGEYHVTALGRDAFASNFEITTIKIPSGVEKIKEKAFLGCINLENVSLSEGLKSIESSAFSVCVNLKQISIPDSVTDIANNAFDPGVLLSGKSEYLRSFVKDHCNRYLFEEERSE